MPTIAIELNDAGLLGFAASPRGAGKLFESPGYALLDGERLVTGREAAKRSRLRPRYVYHRFWTELATGTLPAPFPQELRAADLAHAHLLEVWAPVAAQVDRVLLAVPGSSSEGELGLTLGIARACDMPVVGLVDAALAATAGGSRLASAGTLLHLDIQLHRAVVTELVCDAGSLVRRRVEVSKATGLIPLFDAWAKRLSQLFVRETRFDPLHGAATEQDLYDLMPEWLARLTREERIRVAMTGGGKEHRLAIDREQLVAAADALYEPILALVRGLRRVGEPSTLLLSHRLARLPGLKARLREAPDSALESLAPGAAARGALEQQAKIEGKGEVLPFVTRLVLDSADPPAPPAERPATASSRKAGGGQRPTHLLHGELAYAITREPLLLGVAVPPGSRGLDLSGQTAGISRSHCRLYLLAGEAVVEDHSSYGSFLNGERVQGKARLRAGDRLRLGSPGIELLLIRALERLNGDGPPQD